MCRLRNYRWWLTWMMTVMTMMTMIMMEMTNLEPMATGLVAKGSTCPWIPGTSWDAIKTKTKIQRRNAANTMKNKNWFQYLYSSRCYCYRCCYPLHVCSIKTGWIWGNTSERSNSTILAILTLLPSLLLVILTVPALALVISSLAASAPARAAWTEALAVGAPACEVVRFSQHGHGHHIQLHYLPLASH